VLGYGEVWHDVMCHCGSRQGVVTVVCWSVGRSGRPAGCGEDHST
jgi:hypothetical protein